MSYQFNTINPAQFLALVEAIREGGGGGEITLTTKTINYKGLTITAYKYGRVLLATISGTASEDLATNGAYESVTLGDDFKAILRRVHYTLYSSITSMQIQFTESGALQFGYTRNINTNQAVNINSGNSCYAYAVSISAS